MTCPDLDWLILSTPEKIMMLFSLFGILLLLNLLVFWRSRVSPNKSADIDGINARLLRLTAPVITPSISRMINYSFSATGNFPQRWKTLKLTLCSKKVMQATHLIIVQFLSLHAVLSTLKVIERYVHDSLYDFLQVNNLIYSRQSGFRKHHGS